MTQGFSKKFVKKFVRHYLKYDRDNPFIFISALLAFLGIAAGVMVLMVAMGIMKGTQNEFEKRLFVMNYPLTIKSYRGGVIDIEFVRELENRFPQIKVSPYYVANVITKSATNMQGGILFGVDLKKEKEVNSVLRKYIKGNFQSSFPIIIGDDLALELNVKIGKKILIYFSKNDVAGLSLMPLQKRFMVEGIYNSGLGAYDKVLMYTNFRAFEKVLKREKNRFDGIHIYTKDAFKLKKEIEKMLPKGVYIEGWWEQNGNFFSAMEMEKKALFLVLLLIILVASLNIISSLLMTIMNRRSEIALMRTLGATKKEIYKIFFKVGMILGAGGMVAGTLLGLLSIWVLRKFDIIKLPADVYGTSKLPIDLTLWDFSLIIIGTTIIVWLSSIYPAKKAAKLDPLKVLRNE